MSHTNFRHTSEFDRVVKGLVSGNLSSSQILIDDGNFFVEQNLRYDAEATAGRLFSRRAQDQDIPGVLKCVGSFSECSDGTWSFDISLKAPLDDEFSLPKVCESKETAIAMLWFSRTLL